MAQKIYNDIIDESNSRRYTTFKDNDIVSDKKINDYFDDSINGSRISTYKSVVGELPNGVDNFPVIVIAAKNDTETTNLLNRYIQLVTNTTTDYTAASDYYNIDIQTCGYKNGSFVIDDDATNHGLTLSNGSFSLNGAYADSNNTAYSEEKGKNVFTLVDVQFKDPLHTDKIAYHLYVPVYTIKQMEVGFSATAKTGVDSAKNNSYESTFESNGGVHIDNVNTWLTQYISFSYNKEDINELLAEGNVNWNHNKKVVFDTQNVSEIEVRLPEETSMVLVDPNGNQDKAYYAKISDFDTYNGKSVGWMIDFEKFKNFKVQNINDVISRQITVKKVTNGKYIDGSADDYSVYRIDDQNKLHYYKYVSDSTGIYDLSVDGDVYEYYYISMYVPGSEAAKQYLYYYTINPTDELDGLKTAKVNKDSNKTINVLVADLYTQTTEALLTTDDQQITSTNRNIHIQAKTSIKLNNPIVAAHLATSTLFHSYVFSLNRYTEGGVTNEIFGLDSQNISATYKIDSGASQECSKVDLQKNYLNVETQDILNALRTSSSLTITAEIDMLFDENELDLEFPTKSSETSGIGVNIAAKSNLAYDEDKLVYTSMSKAFAQDSHYYYIESVNTAKLVYEAVNESDEFDINGKASENKSRLGINGKYSTREYMPINTEALYNVSNISDTELEKAKKLRLTLTLSKKTELASGGAEYVQISDMSKYLQENIQITSGKYDQSSYIVGKDSLVVDIPVEECAFESDMYDIGIGFLAKTGDDFHEYSNYKVTLKTELLSSDNSVIENSSASNYIIYTNAKIYQVNN